MDILINVGIGLVAYLIGSLSPAIFISKLNNKNIMKEGSGNAGATNAVRVLGLKLGLLVFFLDLLKGALITLIALLLFGEFSGYIASVMVVIGHIFSVFHKFHAGKGVAPSIGVILVVDWRVGLICFVFGIILVLIIKRVSIGSICAAVCLPLSTWFLCPQYFVFSLIISLLIIVMHRKNIVRLFKGEEKPLEILVRKSKI